VFPVTGLGRFVAGRKDDEEASEGLFIPENASAAAMARVVGFPKAGIMTPFYGVPIAA
jgi:hypothetical protein